jgi:hypothetical protein
MSGRLREILTENWRTAAFVAIGAVLTAVGFTIGGLLAGLPGLFTLLTGVLLREPSRGAPKPHLNLVATRQIELYPSRAIAAIFAAASGEEEPEPKGSADANTGELISGARRELDHEAIRTEAVAAAEASAPRKGMLQTLLIGTMGQFAKPTQADHEEFARKVKAYDEKVGEWLEEVASSVEAEMAVLVAEVELTNEAKLDAEQARVVLRFPKGFEPATDTELLDGPPAVPSFPLRRTGLGLMGAGFSHQPAYPIIGPVDALVRRREEVMAISRREPTYEMQRGELVVSYPRWTIHHGETGTAGEELRVRCTKPGSYEVAWEIHAANLERAVKGTLTVVVGQDAGESVKTLADLEHLMVELGLAKPEDDE